MKKFLKVCFTIAAVLILLGASISIICYAFGGKEAFSNVEEGFRNGVYVKNGIGVHFSDDDDDTDASFRSSGESQKIDTTVNKIDSLKISLGAGKVVIKESTDDFVYIDTDTEYEVVSSVVNGTLKIGMKNGGVDFVNVDNLVTISIPRGVSFKDIKLELGACECLAGSLSASNKADIEVGAGQITIDALNAEELDAEVGAGEIVIKNLTANKADIEVGLGNFESTAKVDKLDLEVAMGNATVHVVGNQSDYDYKAECSMGQLTVGDAVLQGLGEKKNVNNGSNKEMNLECNMGNLFVDFVDSF